MVLRRCHRAGPWAPVMSVEMGPFDAGGDIGGVGGGVAQARVVTRISESPDHREAIGALLNYLPC